MEDDIEKGAMHVHPAVVTNKAQFAESVHEETDAGARGADHIGECFMTDFRNGCFLRAVFPEMSHQQEDPRQPLLAGIEELIYQILLDANVATQDIREE